MRPGTRIYRDILRNLWNPTTTVDWMDVRNLGMADAVLDFEQFEPVESCDAVDRGGVYFRSRHLGMAVFV